MLPAQPMPGDPIVDAALAVAHGMSLEEYERVVARLGRPPTFAELGAVSVLWSEHCSYRSSRRLLDRLPRRGARVLQGPGENAGAVDLGDGVAAVFKIESHNHPSMIDPYQGAATGVGGILRDIFTMGARPIALLDSLRLGRPDHPKTPAHLRGVVAGVGGYANRVGVPTVGGELQFDRSYDDNILVNVFACGVARSERLVLGRAEAVGSTIVYLGAPTGRDGIHGATMASAAFGDDGPTRRPAVQVADPYAGKRLIEACLACVEERLVLGAQDMGAAGLVSASVEIAVRSGRGIALDLDAVPRRSSGMSPYELLLSESQERMLLVCRPGSEVRIRAIAEQWELSVAAVGRITDTGRWVVCATPSADPRDPTPSARSPVVVADLPLALFTDDMPMDEHTQAEDPDRALRLAFDPASLPPPVDHSEQVLQMVGRPNLGSRQWVWRQYDATVRGHTAALPGGDAGVVRVPCDVEGGTVEKWLAFSVDGNGRLVELDPFGGAAMAVAEACRNVVCVGAEPLGLSDGLNLGAPDRPHVMLQLARAIDGIAAAATALDVPVVSGNVSLHNATSGRSIAPTPIVAAVGRLADPTHRTEARFPEAGLTVLLLAAPGAAPGPLGGSEYVVARTGEVKGAPPRIDLEREAALQKLVLALIQARPRLVHSAHDVSDGGLAVALAECCCGDGERAHVGLRFVLPADGASTEEWLFGEAPSRIVVAVDPADVPEVQRRALASGIGALALGTTGGDRLRIEREGRALVDVSLDDVSARRRSCLEPIVGA